jgi:transposase
MIQGTLLPSLSEVKLVCLRPKDGAIQMELQACRSFACCPLCGTSSHRVHSRYSRCLGDLPWERLPVRILLSTRKFFCTSAVCKRRIFTEPLPGVARRYARRTLRATEALDWITLALGGQAGARLAGRLGLMTSGSTLLRQVRRRVQPDMVMGPRVLGIDDWAWKKRHRYGTILCDLEAGKVVDLLPDRESATVADWLRGHPGTQIVSRDRASSYAEAARRAAPGAVQIADRWHLLNNLSEALRTALEPHRRILAQAAQTSQLPDLTEPVPAPQLSAAPAITSKQKNRERRHTLYQQVKALVESGMSQSDVTRQLDVSLRTVQRWTQAGSFPERTPRCFPHSVDAYAAYLDQRLLQGCRNITQLWRELRQQGYHGQLGSVWNWLQMHRRHGKKNAIEKLTRPQVHSSPRHTAWQILKEPASAKAYLEKLSLASPEIRNLAYLGKEFFRIVRSRDFAAWPAWLEAARGTALSRFASGLTRDREAVEAALHLPWSNGAVEGQVHRLKLIKRQMYGRASFDLLRLRVLQKA